MTALDLDMTEPAHLDMFVRLAFIAEQSHDPVRSLSARLATTVLTHGEDIARAEAYNQGSDTAARTVERVIAFMRAVRTERSRYWSVSYDHHGKEFTGTMLHAPGVPAQHEWAVARFGAESVRITEYTDTLTSAPADPDALPGDEHHQTPEVPGAYKVTRFYRFDGEGPAALPDAAAVAYTRQHLYTARPRRFALPPLLLDTVRVVMARPVDVDQVAPLS